MTEPPEKAVIDDLQPFAWSDQESVAYEAALEAINELIGAYTARIEEAKANPDRSAIAEWLEAQRLCSAKQRQAAPTEGHGRC